MAALVASTLLSLQLMVMYPEGNLSPGTVMTVRGNFSVLSWDAGLPLARVATNTFSVTLDIPPSQRCGSLQYKALVDDRTWQVGANEAVLFDMCASASGTFSATTYPFFGTQTGRYEYVRDVFSPQLNNTRDLVVYLPPSYDENYLKPFRASDTLLMHDGQNLFNASTSAFGVAWMCQNTLDSLIPQGDMREIIVIGVDNTPQRIYEYTYSVDPTVGDGGGADAYIDFLVDTVAPLAVAQYRIFDDEPGSRWGILGSSLGGLLSCYAAWTRPQRFGFGGCMSSSFWWNNQDFNASVLPRHAGGAYPSVTALYLDSGDAGPDNDDVTQTRTVRDSVLALGFPYAPVAPQCTAPDTDACPRALAYFLARGAQHSEAYWGARFYVPMQYGFPPLITTPVPTAA